MYFCFTIRAKAQDHTQNYKLSLFMSLVRLLFLIYYVNMFLIIVTEKCNTGDLQGYIHKKIFYIKMKRGIFMNVQGKTGRIIILIICILLWLFAPFLMLNLLTLGNQPTAGIILTLACLLFSKDTLARVLSFLTFIVLLYPMTDYTGICDTLEDYFEVAGYGYWLMLLMMFIFMLIPTGGRDDDQYGNDTDDYSGDDYYEDRISPQPDFGASGQNNNYSGMDIVRPDDR